MQSDSVTPITNDDRLFWAAYRSNAGEEREGELLHRISDAFLGSLIEQGASEGLIARLKREQDRRSQSPAGATLWRQVRQWLRP